MFSEFYEKKSVGIDSEVSTVVRLRPGQSKYLRWIPGRYKQISLLQIVHMDTGEHTTSYSVHARSSFPMYEAS